MDIRSNLLIPFRRDMKRDFATGEGAELLASKVREVLLTDGAGDTTPGELLWRTNFGSKIGLLRHKKNDDILRELCRVYVRDALKKWLPTVTLTSLAIVQNDSAVFIRMSIQELDVEATLDVPVV